MTIAIALDKLPRWIFAFAALAVATATVFGMFFAECRTHIFGLPFGPDRACSVADAELWEAVRNANQRIDGIRLKVVATSTSPEQGCPFNQAADPKNLVVMYGSRDGTSCRVPNMNYYKELALDVPK